MKLGKVPILDTINKIPGGIMVVPLFLGVAVNSLFPESPGTGNCNLKAYHKKIHD